MKAAALNEIRKHLATLDAGTLERACLKLARYKKENKELLTYILFESQDEQAYVSAIREDIDDLFASLPTGNVYYIKKSIRKILRFINRQVRYSDIAGTELDVRIYFCFKIKSAGIALQQGTVLFNLYQQQLKKIRQIQSKLPEDLQFDYDREIRDLSI